MSIDIRARLSRPAASHGIRLALVWKTATIHAARDQDPSQGLEGRLTPVRAKLLQTLSPSCAISRARRHVHVSRRFPLHRPRASIVGSGLPVNDSGWSRLAMFLRSSVPAPRARAFVRHARRRDHRRAGRKSQGPQPYTPHPAEVILERPRDAPLGRSVDLAPVFRERLCWRRVHARPRLFQARQLLQLDRSAREHHVLGLQTSRSRVCRSTVVSASSILSLIGGWREATQVAFFGIGPTTTSGSRTSYSFQQPYARGLLEFRPTRRVLLFGAGAEISTWNTRRGKRELSLHR